MLNKKEIKEGLVKYYETQIILGNRIILINYYSKCDCLKIQKIGTILKAQKGIAKYDELAKKAIFLDFNNGKLIKKFIVNNFEKVRSIYLKTKIEDFEFKGFIENAILEEINLFRVCFYSESETEYVFLHYTLINKLDSYISVKFDMKGVLLEIELFN